MPDGLSIFELFSTLPDEFKVAMLIQQSQGTAKDIFFAERVAKHQSIRMGIFFTREKSLQWLNS